jgi:DNA polymerase-4
VRDKAALGDIFTDLCMRLGEDLQRKGYVAKTIGIKLRYDDFKIATRDQTSEFYTDDGAAIRRLAGQCLKRVPLDKKLRLLGVRAATLARADEVPPPDEKKPSGAAERADLNTTEQLF